MPFDVQEFKSVIQDFGLMRNNKFLVQFALPPKLTSVLSETNSGQILSMFCKAAPLPGIGILTQDIYRYGYGPIERRPYGTVVNDIMFHFYVDGSNIIRKWFRNWIRIIINPDSAKGINSTFPLTGQNAYEVGYKEDYAVDVRVVLFTPEGLPKISVTLIEAYPNYIGDIHQDWDDRNTNMLLPISLTFRDWYEDSLPDMNSGSPTAAIQANSPLLQSTTPFIQNVNIQQFPFFNPNINLDTSGAVPLGVQTPFGIRF
jgi:hypothetical protein